MKAGLILVGRIALMWSQVEFFLDEILSLAHKLHVVKLRVLMGDRLTGQRIDILDKCSHLIENEEARNEAEVLIINLKKIRQARNHVMHGLWGWFNPDHGEYEAAALSHKVKIPFSHANLVEHHDAICAETHRAVDVFLLMVGQPKGSFHTNFYFGPSLRPRPEALVNSTVDQGSLRSALS